MDPNDMSSDNVNYLYGAGVHAGLGYDRAPPQADLHGGRGGLSSSSTSSDHLSPQGTPLCASCDRCRKRKTKCDGNRPCENCVSKYLRKNKLHSTIGIDIACFDCVYSPAKRRGPVPGQNRQKYEHQRALPGQLVGIDDSRPDVQVFHQNNSGGGFIDQHQHLNDMLSQSEIYRMNTRPGNFGRGDQSMSGLKGDAGMHGNYLNSLDSSDLYTRAQQLQHYGETIGSSSHLNSETLRHQQRNDFGSIARLNVDNVQKAQSQLNNLDGNSLAANLLDQERQYMLRAQMMPPHNTSMLTTMSVSDALTPTMIAELNKKSQGSADNDNLSVYRSGKRGHNSGDELQSLGLYNNKHQQQQQEHRGKLGMLKGPLSSLKHSHLLNSNSREGNLLRSYYHISVDELLNLPPIPSDEEYCQKLNDNLSPENLPIFDLAALKASRFSEIALGALASNQVALALELSNATVMCLRECVEEPVHPSCMFELARAYLLHGIFRSFRGDMLRYFKYRRVCLTHLSTQLDTLEGTNVLLATISLHDAWAYMMYNACEDDLPNIDGVIPPLPQIDAPDITYDDDKAKLLPSRVVRNPDNQMWIQGPPPIFTNNEAPTLCRSLDALSCAIRSCCDQANERHVKMITSNGEKVPEIQISSVTSRAVMANEQELCSRNMVASASALLQQESNRNVVRDFKALNIMLSSMGIFLEDGDEDSNSGFTDNQIQGLLDVCNQFIESPYILWNPGPTYHMMTNATILISHLLNGFHEKRNKETESNMSDMEAAMYDELLTTFITSRKIIEQHRQKLPSRLRCHGIPKANLFGDGKEPLVDLDHIVMCSCMGCQNFVLMGCSPCVAAERAQAAALQRELEMSKSPEFNSNYDKDEYEAELDELGNEFDLDDDTLLGVLSRIITG